MKSFLRHNSRVLLLSLLTVGMTGGSVDRIGTPSGSSPLGRDALAAIRMMLGRGAKLAREGRLSGSGKVAQMQASACKRVDRFSKYFLCK